MAYEELPRVKTGIQGLDKALNGGFPAGNIILISGGAGTGKIDFRFTICNKRGFALWERGLYITTEQTKEELYRQASCFKWPLLELEQRNMLKIVYLDVMQGDSFLEKLDALVMSFEPKRIVIDSLTTLTDALIVSGISEDKGFSMVQIAETVSPIPRTDKIMTKSILYRLFKEIKKFKVTSILTSELPEDEKSLSADGVSEFVADGVILLKSMTVGDSSSRNLELKKMRYTPIDGGLKSYDITPSGITLE